MPRKKTPETPAAETPERVDEPEACSEMNEGIPTKPLPKEGLPDIKQMQPDPDLEESKAKGDATKGKRSRDGMAKALDILDEYYDETPKRDIRFHHDEE